jgi:hypothetical protein
MNADLVILYPQNVILHPAKRSLFSVKVVLSLSRT